MIDIACSYLIKIRETIMEKPENMPGLRICRTVSEFFPLYTPEPESDGSVFEQILCSSGEKRAGKYRDEEEAGGQYTWNEL